MHFNLFVTLQYGAGRGPGAGKVPHLLYSARDLSLCLWSRRLRFGQLFNEFCKSGSSCRPFCCRVAHFGLASIQQQQQQPRNACKTMLQSLLLSRLPCNLSLSVLSELSCLCIYLHLLGGQRDRGRDKGTNRQRDRGTDRQTDGRTDRQTDR